MQVILKGNQIYEKTIFEIGKFSILWSMLENEIFGCHLKMSNIKDQINKMSYDEDSVRKLKIVINDRKLKLNVDVWKYTKDHLELPESNKLGDYKNDVINFIDNDEINIYGCLLFITKIRNNLLHGPKGVYDLDNQLELFKAINDVLENIHKK